MISFRAMAVLQPLKVIITNLPNEKVNTISNVLPVFISDLGFFSGGKLIFGNRVWNQNKYAIKGNRLAAFVDY